MMQTTEPVTAKSIRATEEGLVIVLRNRQINVSWKRCSDRVAQATDQERMCVELSPGGYGVHWPLIDEDLTISGLLSRGG